MCLPLEDGETKVAAVIGDAVFEDGLLAAFLLGRKVFLDLFDALREVDDSLVEHEALSSSVGVAVGALTGRGVNVLSLSEAESATEEE